MNKFDKRKWNRKVSYIKIEPKCVFEGFENSNFEKSLGKWRGRFNDTNSHEMDPEYEDNKMKSFKCKCFQNQTCVDRYTYG